MVVTVVVFVDVSWTESIINSSLYLISYDCWVDDSWSESILTHLSSPCDITVESISFLVVDSDWVKSILIPPFLL